MSTIRGGRATLNAVVMVLLAAVGLGALAGFTTIAVAAVWSLVGGPGDVAHGALYVAAALAMPILLLWVIQGLAEAQRARMHTIVRVDITRPGVRNAWWPIGPWRSAATWRALEYHLVAVFVGGFGGLVVLACWLAPVLAYAWVWENGQSDQVLVVAEVVALGLVLIAHRLAMLLSRWDAGIGAALLGPSHSDELTARVASLSRSRAEVVEATDAERRRIERDLHDGAQQRLVALAMNLGVARATLTDVPEPARTAIADAHDQAVLALADMRAFIRGLHPAVLNDRGLDAALSGLVAHAAVPVRLSVDVAERTSPSVEAVAYFIVSEALTNVAKYAEASRADVTVTRIGDRLRIVVADDGKGGAAPTGDGTGLPGLARRAASVDGTLRIDSPVGGPTTITAELPCES
jgi:signal transduction histidine kinase